MRNMVWSCLTTFILFILSNTATGVDHLYHVPALIGGPFDMLILQNFSQPVKEVLWKFTRESRTHKIAEFKANISEINPQLVNRLEILRSGIGLRIKNGTFKDSGNYSASITLENNEIISVSFSVDLYEPVSDPTIRTRYEKEKGSLHGRHHWFLFIPVLFVFLLGAACAACITYCKKEDEEVKLSIPETDHTVSLPKNNAKEEEPFQVPEYAEKYSQQGFISVHDGKLEEKKYNA